MKRLLPFTFFCCFSISSIYAVQEQDRVIDSKSDKTVKVDLKDSKVESSTSLNASKLSAKKAGSNDMNQFRGAFGHAIKRIGHREIIDKRRRIASNN